MSDMRSVMEAQRELQDLKTKSKLIGANTILGLEQGDRTDLNRENKRLGQFRRS
jgi:hypothetical protein